MKIKLLALSSIFLGSMFATGCTTTPKGFAKASTRVSCKYLKKCEEDAWDLAGFDNVGDCVDEFNDDYSPDDFADDCDDYDRKEARKCLRAARKAKRSCDEDDFDDDACSKVCGTVTIDGLESEDEDGANVTADELLASGEMSEEEYEDAVAEEELAAAEEEELLQREIDEIMASED